MNALKVGTLLSENINIVIGAVVIYFFVMWFCLVVWVIKDITNRAKSSFAQIFCVLLVLIGTPLGVFIYLLIRPQKTLFERTFEAEFFRLNEEIERQEKEVKNTKTSPKISNQLDIQIPPKDA